MVELRFKTFQSYSRDLMINYYALIYLSIHLFNKYLLEYLLCTMCYLNIRYLEKDTLHSSIFGAGDSHKKKSVQRSQKGVVEGCQWPQIKWSLLTFGKRTWRELKGRKLASRIPIFSSASKPREMFSNRMCLQKKKKKTQNQTNKKPFCILKFHF